VYDSGTAMRYAFIQSVIYLALVVLFVRQLQHFHDSSNGNPDDDPGNNALARVSMLSIGLMALTDAVLAMLHVTIGIGNGITFCDILLSISTEFFHTGCGVQMPCSRPSPRRPFFNSSSFIYSKCELLLIFIAPATLRCAI
jgi:hypothetical protein